MKDEKKKYIPPQLTVVCFKSEKGYASSGGIFSLFMAEPEPSGQIEAYSEHDEWSQSGSFW